MASSWASGRSRARRRVVASDSNSRCTPSIRVRTLSTDPSGGTSGAFAFAATRNQDQYFFFPSQNAFANWVNVFDYLTTPGQNARMAAVDLFSNGYNWFIMNYPEYDVSELGFCPGQYSASDLRDAWLGLVDAS